METRKIDPNSMMKEFKNIIDKKQLYLKLVNELDLEKAVIMLSNGLSLNVSFNANITISADNQEISNQYGEALSEMMEKIYPNSCGPIEEKDLYDRKLWNYRIRKYKIVMVKSCLAKDPEKLYTALYEIEKSGWKPAVILCTTYEGLERLKAYEFQDYRLYHYLCGHKICVADINCNNVLDTTIESLERAGYSITDDFREKLDRYIQAVYPEARLTKQKFVDDLVYRINQAHCQKIVDGMTLDATDVPYSEKAEKLISEKDLNLQKTAIGNEDLQGTKKENAEITGKHDQSKNQYRISTVKSVKTHFTDLENSKNVLILSMSTLPNVKPTSSPVRHNYCVIEDDGLGGITYRVFTGISQLEPGTKFFISKLADQELKADKIIVLTTDETKKKEVAYGNKSAVDVYCDNIAEYLVEGDQVDPDAETLLGQEIADRRKINPQKIEAGSGELYLARKDISDCEENQPGQDLRQLIDVEIVDLNDDSLRKIMTTLNALSNDQHVNLFIDLQGGSRTFMFTLFAAMTMLRDRNVTIKELFAIKYDNAYTIHPIEIVNSEYAIIDLVAGIRAFSRYGKVEELKRFIENRESNGKDNENEKRLLEIMEEIDGCMQINDPEGFSIALGDLSKNDAALLNKDFYSDSQFKLIVEDLEDAYRPLIEAHSVLDQIKWFGEREFISSALTFIEDKIPGFMINNGIDPIIKVSYNPEDMGQETVASVLGAPNYYRKENNVFNIGFSSIIQKKRVGNPFNRELCRIWAQRILDGYPEEKRTEANEKKIEDVLYHAIFWRDGIEDKEVFHQDMSFLLVILKRILPHAKVEYINDEFTYYLEDKAEPVEFGYAFWKAIISLCTGISLIELENKIKGYEALDCNLCEERLGREQENYGEWETSELIEFAEAYIYIRKDSHSVDLYDNVNLYVNLDDDDYYQLCKRYFHISGERGKRRCLQTIAGIKNRYLKIWDKITIRIGSGNESWENKALLDVCIRFYQSLKKERNATNHADESTSNHMPYRYTKKAIFVFVELCKRLEQAYIHGINP